MNKTTVSVALATYNGQRYLAQQLASIARQSRPPDELLIGDDQSSDATEAIVLEFAKSVKFSVVFSRNRERLGSSQNFAALLARCRGDVILLSDQDDEWAEQRVERSLEVLDGNRAAAFAFSNAALINGDGTALTGSLWDRAFFGPAQQRKFALRRGSEVLLRTNVVTGATMAIRRDRLPSALPVPAGWVHDGWLAFMLELQYGAVAVDEPWISYRVHAAQQIGVLGLSPRSLLLTLRRQDARFYRQEAENFRVLSARVRELGSAYAQVADAALQKSAFLERRAAGREDLLDCLRGLGESLVSRSYRQYGLGAKQAAFDVLGASDAAAARALARLRTH